MKKTELARNTKKFWEACQLVRRPEKFMDDVLGRSILRDIEVEPDEHLHERIEATLKESNPSDG